MEVVHGVLGAVPTQAGDAVLDAAGVLLDARLASEHLAESLLTARRSQHVALAAFLNKVEMPLKLCPLAPKWWLSGHRQSGHT